MRAIESGQIGYNAQNISGLNFGFTFFDLGFWDVCERRPSIERILVILNFTKLNFALCDLMIELAVLGHEFDLRRIIGKVTIADFICNNMKDALQFAIEKIVDGIIEPRMESLDLAFAIAQQR